MAPQIKTPLLCFVEVPQFMTGEHIVPLCHLSGTEQPSQLRQQQRNHSGPNSRPNAEPHPAWDTVFVDGAKNSHHCHFTNRSQRGAICSACSHPRGTGQYLVTFLVVTTGEVLVASHGWRPEMPLNTYGPQSKE